MHPHPANCAAKKTRIYTDGNRLRSCAARESGQLLFREAHALGQDDAEAVKECGLGWFGLGDATQANLDVCCGWQHNVMGLNACEFFEDRARRVSEAGAALSVILMPRP